MADVNKTITTFDTALAAGDYAAACRLLAPVLGTASLVAATDAVGIYGTCPERLAGFATIVGTKLLRKLNPAWTKSLRFNRRWTIQYARTQLGGFNAAGLFPVADRTLSKTVSIQSVGFERANRNAPVLITCPPLVCDSRAPGSSSLVDYLRYKKFAMRPAAQSSLGSA